MNDNDDLNDGAVLSAVRDSISGVPLATAPRLEAITARGRARRRRRLGGLSMAGPGRAPRWSPAWLAARALPGQHHSTPRPRSIWRRSRSSPAPTAPRH